MSPFGARGLNSGVGDAENAAWKLAYVLRGRAGEELLESYHDERHAAAVENLEVTTATMNVLVPQTPEQHEMRRSVLSAAAADPAARARVDSGRLSEPFWYVASPLTTPCPSRPFAGRPPRGGVPPAGPGILAPDVPVASPGRTRFRELAREGFLVLAAPGAEHVTAPVPVVPLASIDVTGALAEALDARPGELWLIRPDAYVAAVIGDPAELAPALARALGAQPRAASNPATKAVRTGT